MRLPKYFAITLSVVLLTIDTSVFASDSAMPPPLEQGLSERIERRLIQFEVRVSRKGSPVSGLLATDFDVALGGKPLKNFKVDDMCGDRSDSVQGVSVERQGSSVFYFDEPELTLEGRVRAVEVARLVVAPLLAHGHDLLILRNGASVRAETRWTNDPAEVFAALDRIAADLGNSDYLADAPDEQKLERLIDEAKSVLGANAMGATAARRNAEKEECISRSIKMKQIARTQDTLNTFAMDDLAANLKSVVDHDLRRSRRDFQRLRGAVQSLSLRGSPKSMLYFADTLRTNPGRVITVAMNTLESLDGRSSAVRPESTIGLWNEDGELKALVRDASAYGVRFYAIEGRGLMSRSDWVRASQDTLASLALDTGGLSFVNGLSGSVIADRVAADQSCWYLVSFDPAGWDEDRPLRLDVWSKRAGLRVSTASSLMIPSEETRLQARLLAAHLGDGAPEDPPLSVSIYPVGGTSKRLDVMAQALLPEAREPNTRETAWDVGFQVVSQGTVVSHTSNRVTWRGTGAAQVYQTTLSVPTGPYEIIVVARSPGTDSVRQGRVQGVWPPVPAERVTLSLPALAQPHPRGVFVDGQVNPHGVVVRGGGDLVDPRDPVGIVTAVCIDAPDDVVFRAERSIAGENEVSFAPMSLRSEKGRCVQIRDMVPAGSLGAGRMTYVVRILSGEDTIASQDLTFDVADVSAVPQAAVAAAAN